MKKKIILGMVLLLAVGFVVASKNLQISITKPDTSRKGEIVQVGEKRIGPHGEAIVTHEKGVDILPPQRESKSFQAYKTQRLSELHQTVLDKTEVVSAQVTFDEALLPPELKELLGKYSVNVIGIEGLKDDNLVGMRYVKFVQDENTVDKVLSMVVEGNPIELTKLQQNKKVLLVDPNIEGFHARVQ